MTISVSTASLQLADAGLGHRMRRWPSKWNGLVTTPTVRMPLSRATAGDRGCRTRAGAAAHAGGDEDHVRAGEMIDDLVDHLFGGRAADFRLRAGAEAFGDLEAELDDALGAGRVSSACASVLAHDEIDAVEAGLDHVVDGIAAGATDTEDGDAGLSSRMSGACRFIAMIASFTVLSGSWRAVPSSTPGALSPALLVLTPARAAFRPCGPQL
jgi:hypothetical protein